MAVIKKTLQQQIDETKAKLKELKSQQKEKVLEVTSPGMEQLLAAIEVVIKENKCKVFDILKSVSRIKKTGAKIEPGTRNKGGTTSTESESKTTKLSTSRKSK